MTNKWWFELSISKLHFNILCNKSREGRVGLNAGPATILRSLTPQAGVLAGHRHKGLRDMTPFNYLHALVLSEFLILLSFCVFIESEM